MTLNMRRTTQALLLLTCSMLVSTTLLPRVSNRTTVALAPLYHQLMRLYILTQLMLLELTATLLKPRSQYHMKHRPATRSSLCLRYHMVTCAVILGMLMMLC
jgi:hypothetical protein